MLVAGSLLTAAAGSAAAVPAWEAEVRALLDPALRPTTLLSAPADAWQISTAGGVTHEDVAVTGEKVFSLARRVAVPRVFETPWGANAHSPLIEEPVPSGRVLFVALWLRCPVLQGGQSATVRLYLDRATGWDGLGQTGSTLDGNWRLVFISCVTQRDYAANTLRLSAHLGLGRQDVEFGPITVLDLGAADEVDLRGLPVNEVRWPGMEADAAWRAEAERRIDALRRRDLALSVRDAADRPVAGARVELSQRKRTFSFGSFTGYRLLDDTPDGAKLREQFATLFDRVSVPIFWADWGWLQNEDQYVALAEWAQAQRPVDIRGHTLIYPDWRYLPSKLREMRDDPAAMQAACLAQIRWVAQRLKHVQFDEIDVTNELRTLTEVVGIIGREGVVEWFAEARRAFPGVKLCLNENTILTNGGKTEAEQENLLEWYRFLKSHGQAPDVLGLQGHFSEAVTGAEDLWRILDRIAAETEAEIQVTEYDFNTLNDQLQADYTRDFLTALYAHPRVTGIALWGIWEGDHWLPNARPLEARLDGPPDGRRPARAAGREVAHPRGRAQRRGGDGAHPRIHRGTTGPGYVAGRFALRTGHRGPARRGPGGGDGAPARGGRALMSTDRPGGRRGQGGLRRGEYPQPIPVAGGGVGWRREWPWSRQLRGAPPRGETRPQ
jgi:endo-1,4-beta-xylanase